MRTNRGSLIQRVMVKYSLHRGVTSKPTPIPLMSSVALRANLTVLSSSAWSLPAIHRSPANEIASTVATDVHQANNTISKLNVNKKNHELWDISRRWPLFYVDRLLGSYGWKVIPVARPPIFSQCLSLQTFDLTTFGSNVDGQAWALQSDAESRE